MQNLIVIIMAGGLGKRMNSTLPKVLHPISNEPMLVRVIKQALVLNPKKILIVVGKYKNIIESTIKAFVDLNNILFVNQTEALGTGHAIQCCIPELVNYDNSNVLILSGDVPLLKSSTMLNLISKFNKVKLMTSIFDNPHGCGRILETNNLFDRIIEEKDCTLEEKKINKVNCGIYAFNSNILCKYLPLLNNNNSQGEYYLTDIVEIIKKNENINIDMYEISKDKQIEIIGVNTAEQLVELENLAKNIS
jgi:UDP-N-acetylglucosamine diphosphorylase/glucosamine-1-phosphate N-acetyltransferase